MDLQLTQALDVLRDLGTPKDMRAWAPRGYRPADRPNTNAHIHLPPNFSAFDTVEQAVTLAADQGIAALGVSNYYDFTVYGEFAELARQRGIFPLFGLEIIAMQDDLRDANVRVNDPGNPGKTYLCGKGITRFDTLSPQATRLMERIRANDGQRMTAMVGRMCEVLASRGFTANVSDRDVVNMVVHRHGSAPETVFLQERHISQLFQEEFFKVVPAEERLERLAEVLGGPSKLADPHDHLGFQNELRSHLMKAGKPAFVEESFLTFAEARELVLELGGIPSYPVLADGTVPLCEFEADPQKLIAALMSRGVHAVEWIPVRNSQSVVEQYVKAMREAGLLVTAGTEHNTLDLIPFDPACKDGPVPPSVREIFWEGTCVVAAHQFLSLHGECGFVDDRGQPNRSYQTAEVRIKTMAEIGSAVIQRYSNSFDAN